MGHPVDIWFVCKLCQGLFTEVSELLQHKFESHSRECKTLKAIIFEERGAFPPPEPEPDPEPGINIFVEELTNTRLTRLATKDLNNSNSETNELNIIDTSTSKLSIIQLQDQHQDQDQDQPQHQLQLDQLVSTSPSKSVDESPQLYSCKFTNIHPEDAVVFTRQDGCLTINISRFSPSQTQTPSGPTRNNSELEAGASEPGPLPLPSPVLAPQEDIYQELETVGLSFVDDVSMSMTPFETAEAAQVIGTDFSTMYEAAHLHMDPEPAVDDFVAPVSVSVSASASASASASVLDLDAPENDCNRNRNRTEGTITQVDKNSMCESMDLDEIFNDLPEPIFQTDQAVAPHTPTSNSNNSILTTDTNLIDLDLSQVKLPIPIPIPIPILLLGPSSPIETEIGTLTETEIPVTSLETPRPFEIETLTEGNSSSSSSSSTGHNEGEANLLSESLEGTSKINLNRLPKPPYVLLRRLNSKQLKLATNRNSNKKIPSAPRYDPDPDFDPDIRKNSGSSSKSHRSGDLKCLKRKQFACSVCHRAFESKPRLRVHLKSHSSEKPFKCTHLNCNSSFVHKYSLEDHLKRHENPASKIYYVFPDHLDTAEESNNSQTGHKGHHGDPVKLTSTLTLAEWVKKEQGANTKNVILLEPDPLTGTGDSDSIGPISLTNRISCKLCTRILTSDTEVKIHVQHCWTHNGLRHRYCVPCKKPFSHPSDLKIHNGKIHSNSRSDANPDIEADIEADIDKKIQHLLKCLHCNKQYVNFRDFEIHQETHKKLKIKSAPAPAVVCHICGYPCFQKSYFAAHLKTHSNFKEFKCYEPQCTAVCKTKVALTAHIKRMHSKNPTASDTRPFKCPILHCCHSYRSKDALKGHQLTHNDPENGTGDGEGQSQCFTCPVANCAKKYFSQKSVKIHAKKVHNLDMEIDSPSLSCQMCRKTFANVVSLKFHSCVRSASKIFKCTISNCTASFKQKYRLVNHEREHSGQNPYVCDTCGKSYAKSVSFYKHRKTHETAEKGSKFPCHLCPRKFPGRWELKQHLLVHEKGAQFVCQFCGKKCAKKENLVMHEKSHGKIRKGNRDRNRDRNRNRDSTITTTGMGTSDSGDLTRSSSNSNSGAATDSEQEAAAEALIAKFPEFFRN